MIWNATRTLGNIVLILTLTGCDFAVSEKNLTFVTRSGMGIDKWASIWLIKRHIAPNADIIWLDSDDKEVEGVLFDTENALYKRTGQASTFSTLAEGFNLGIDFLPDFLQLVHDVEINYWAPSELFYSDYVENEFRQLQEKFGQENTPMACYLAFFDNVSTQIPVFQNLEPDKLYSLAKLIPEESCSKEVQTDMVTRNQLVAEWPVETVLKAIEQGQRVVFMDVREADEFKEVHIPGAVNVKIREIPNFDFNLIADADLVVPYCVKDFRAFEMARLLKQNGVANVILMRPYGLKGWVTVGLPTTGNSIQEDQGIKKLTGCANNPHTCLKPERRV